MHFVAAAEVVLRKRHLEFENMVYHVSQQPQDARLGDNTILVTDVDPDWSEERIRLWLENDGNGGGRVLTLNLTDQKHGVVIASFADPKRM